ncbi:recombinase family protein [Sphaerisporangium perillae]|uniref:recombinase family protein n=1 Tax=Sphaerisporangium perillae TaxID=2935860 RepID=UPI00200F773E|nr:recombinase family protein [Sphaerisporangium perillae]
MLAVKRISRDTEQSSALERQDVQLAEAIRKGRHAVAGWVEDATVSGAVNLDKRPSLGKWLREPLIHEWDAMMVTSQDRITRDDLHWAAFVGWVLENNKTVVILDDPAFDLSTPNGRMIANIKATQAANYRKSVQEKKLNQLEWYREEQLWAGGTWPFGYRAVRVEHKGGMRWRLDVDPVTGPLVREAYDRLVNKSQSMGGIAKDWNARGILTTLDYQRHTNATEGREGTMSKVKGTKWATSSLKAVLSKPALMGYAIHRGEVLKKNGLPVQWAEPILTREEFDKLQDVLDRRGSAYRNVDRETTPLVGILYCACGEMMYANSADRKLANGSTRHYSYYLCKTIRVGTKCQYQKSWEREVLQLHLEDAFLSAAGDLEITIKTYVPGSDRSSDIKELREALDNLAGNLVHMKPGSAGANAVIKGIEEHEAALAELEALPMVPSRWEESGTGETFRQFWERNPAWETRCELLRKAGVRLYVAGNPKAPDLDLFIPEDLQQRIIDALSDAVEPGFIDAADLWAAEAMAQRRDSDAALRDEAR